jgi:bifunctional non-homologous end joining protein LigD
VPSFISGIWEALRSLPAKSAIIDAEIVACREDGAPDFRALHSGNYSDEVLCAWCFDMMELNGVDLTPLPLMARKSGWEPLPRALRLTVR